MSAPALRELQRAFWRALTAEGGNLEPALLDAIAPTRTLEREERFAIYAGMYFWRIVDALREDFSRVAALLGDEGFQAVVRRYLALHPSRHPSLRPLGRELPGFLATHPPPGAPPFLADLARLEWARLEVFDAPDAVPLTLDALRTLRPERWPSLRFSPIQALAVLTTNWPVHRVWDSGETDPLPTLGRARTTLRVWRQGFVVFHSVMDELEARALGRLCEGQTFAAICEDAASAEEAGALLLRWIEDGIIARAE